MPIPDAPGRSAPVRACAGPPTATSGGQLPGARKARRRPAASPSAGRRRGPRPRWWSCRPTTGRWACSTVCGRPRTSGHRRRRPTARRARRPPARRAALARRHCSRRLPRSPRAAADPTRPAAPAPGRPLPAGRPRRAGPAGELADLGVGVHLQGTGRCHVPGLVRAGDHVRDALTAGAVRPVRAKPVRVVPQVDGRLVRRRDVALLRVEHAGQGLEGNLLDPLVGAVPPESGPPPVALTADREPPRRLVADIAVGVGVDHVRRRDLVQPRRLAELLEVRGPVQHQDGIGGAARVQSRPAQRHRQVRAGPAGRRILGDLEEELVGVGEQWAVTGGTHADRHRIPTGHLDPLRADLHRLLLAIHDHGVAAHLLQVQVGNIGAEVGEAPRDVVVVPQDHPGNPDQRHPCHPVGALRRHRPAAQTHLIVRGGHGLPPVGVVGQDRLARLCAGSRQDPRVRPHPWTGRPQ
jgi:hypothetical protein